MQNRVSFAIFLSIHEKNITFPCVSKTVPNSKLFNAPYVLSPEGNV